MEKRRTRLFCLLVVVAVGCNTAQANLVQDGDFSASSVPAFSSHWTATLGTGLEAYEEFGSGNPVALFNEPWGAGDMSLAQTVENLIVGQDYTVAFDLSIESGDSGETDTFEVLFGGQTVFPLWQSTSAYPSIVNLTPFQASIAASDTSALLEFKCFFDDDSPFTTIIVDNVSVTPVPVPPSVVLAGLGLLSGAAGAGMAGCRARILGGRRARRV